MDSLGTHPHHAIFPGRRAQDDGVIDARDNVNCIALHDAADGPCHQQLQGFGDTKAQHLTSHGFYPGREYDVTDVLASAVGTTQTNRAMILIEENLTGSGRHDPVTKDLQDGTAQPPGIDLVIARHGDSLDASWAQCWFCHACLIDADSVDVHARPVLEFQQFIEGLMIGRILSADEGGTLSIPDSTISG